MKKVMNSRNETASFSPEMVISNLTSDILTFSTGRSKILAAQFFSHTLHSELMLLTSMEKLSDFVHQVS